MTWRKRSLLIPLMIILFVSSFSANLLLPVGAEMAQAEVMVTDDVKLTAEQSGQIEPHTLVAVVYDYEEDFSQVPLPSNGYGSGEPDPEPLPLLKLAEVRQQDVGSTVRFEGIVTASFLAGGQFNLYLQDETAGIVVRGPNLTMLPGMKLQVEGDLQDYFGLAQVQVEGPTAVSIVEEEAGIPAPQKILATDLQAGAGEAWEAQLVQLSQVTILSVPDARGNVRARDEAGEFIIRLRGGLTTEVGQFYPQLLGVVDYHFEEYKVMPRSADDLGQEVPAQLQIHHLQGAGHRSPYEGQVVTGIEGVVTYVNGNHGFYLQSLQPDDDPGTSEGIYVFRKNHTVQEGDRLLVSGEVVEYRERGYDDAPDLTTTQLVARSLQTVERGVALPAPVRLGQDGRFPPQQVVDPDHIGQFNPEKNALDFYESLEGMLIEVDELTVVAPGQHQEVIATFPLGRAQERTPAAGVLLQQGDVNTNRLFIKWDLPVNVGDRLEGSLRGVVGYDFSNYKIYPLEPLPRLIQGEREQPVTSLQPQEELLTIATYNVENFAATSDIKKTRRLAQNIVHQLKSPDIVALVEIQDNDGPKDSGITDASQTYETLISAILVEGGPHYAYTDIAPLDKQDGGQPGANIRVGYIYNPARMTLVEKPKGDATTAVRISADGLSHNPGRIMPQHEAFHNSRKPLAAQFQFQGETVILIHNHFNSKRGDSPLFGVEQPPLLRSEEQRLQMAEIVHQFVTEVEAVMPEAHVVVLGDLNDFQFSLPVQKVAGQRLVNVIDLLPVEQQYTYNYQGNSQVLDHILISKHLATGVEAEIINLNSDFHGTAGRASDHDPVLVQLDLKRQSISPPTGGQLSLVGPRYGAPGQVVNLIVQIDEGQGLVAGDLRTTWGEGIEVRSIQPLNGSLQLFAGESSERSRRTLFFSPQPLQGSLQLWQLKLQLAKDFEGENQIQIVGELVGVDGQEQPVVATFTFEGLHYDLNGDGRVSVGDLGLFANYFGKNKGSAEWQEAERADFNGDGRVDRADLQRLVQAILEADT